MLTMTERIKGTRSYSAAEFKEYIYRRNKAYQSFDYKRIAKVMMAYGIEPPPQSPQFWEEVARAVLGMREEASESARREAVRILDELNCGNRNEED